MLLVVFQHVRYFMCGLTDVRYDTLAYFFISFRMPMFFFISGYIAYKMPRHWSGRYYIDRLKTKAKVQLIPTSIFWLLMSLTGLYIWSFPGGFWFTEALFIMFLIYFSCAYILRKSKIPYIEECVLILLAFLFFSVKSLFLMIPAANLCGYFCLNEVGTYIPYFVFGIIAKKNINTFNVICGNGKVLAVIIIASISLLIAQYKLDSLYYNGPVTGLKGILLVILIFACFKSNAEYWNKRNTITNTLEYIGRRTLDLYLIHYFFLTRVPSIGQYLSEFNNIVIELLVVSVLTISITFMSLLVSNLLRTSSTVSKLLFGTK